MTDLTIIEGTATDVSQGAVVVAQPQSGMDVYERPRVDPLRYLGTMSDADFRAEVAVIKGGTDRIGQIYKEVMRPEVDYGIIPGTKNPSLLQPGAERLAMMARLIPRHEQHITYTPGENGWPEEVRVDTQTFLHAGALDGPVVGSAVASCTSYEDRYLYRSSERVCPACGKPVIIRGNPQYAPRTRGREGDVLPGYEQGGWLCWKKKDGCGKQFQDNDRAITDQAVGKAFVENPRGLINTLTQISAKRGFVGAIRHTLGITDLFTQDVEDMPTSAPEAGSSAVSETTPRAASAPSEPAARSAPARQAPPAAAATGSSAPVAAPDAPGALIFEGPVVATPDGIRSTSNGRVLNVAIKVKASKHNLELWDAMADAVLPFAVEGAILKVTGVRHEEEWPGRGDRPMKKVIKDITRVELVEDVLGAPTSRVIASAAPKAPQPVQQALPTSERDDGPPLFDDDDLGHPGAPEALPFLEPVQLTGDPSAVADLTGTIRRIEWMEQPTRFLYMEVLVPENGYIKVAMKEAEAKEQIALDDGSLTIGIGQRVRVMGGWNGKGVMVVAGIVAVA